MKLKHLFAMLEARNQIAEIFNLPREVLTLVISKRSESETPIAIFSYRCYSDFAFTGHFDMSNNIHAAIDRANFDECLFALAGFETSNTRLLYSVEYYSVQALIELDKPRKGKK